MALFCVQIDYFAMNLALPRMASDLHSSPTDLQWVISVYMLALGAFMVPAGRIGDIFGRRRALLAGVALFGVASALCALAPSATLVIAFRAVQGLGAALIFPLAIGAWSISESSDETVPRRIDIAGLALVTFGIGLFTLTFDRAPHWGWLSAWTVVAFAGSLVALAVFVVVANIAYGVRNSSGNA
jgi:MFS family permease